MGTTPNDVVDGAVPQAYAEEITVSAYRCSLCSYTDLSEAQLDQHLWLAHPASRDPEITCQAWATRGSGWCVRPLGHDEVEGDPGHWTPSYSGGTWWQGPRGEIGAGRGERPGLQALRPAANG